MWPHPQLRQRGWVAPLAGADLVSRTATVALAILAMLVVGFALPSGAAAHGPVDPSATSYLAAATSLPGGVEAKVIDGDQRMWIRVEPARSVVVLDYRGVPYLRFSRSGVAVNLNSAMYYLNQVPAQLPPSGLGASTSPRWSMVSAGHEYGWHDGRLHALAATALAPGTTYVGRWTIPLLVDGGRTVIAGGLRYAPNPPLVWFWPIIVAFACVFAGLRLRRGRLDLRLARGLSVGALISVAVLATGQGLHGRPSVSVGQLVGLAIVLVFVGWALARLASDRHGWFGYFSIAGVAIWQGTSVLTVLTRGFVLLAVPATVARVATVLALACGVSLLPIVFRIADHHGKRSGDVDVEDELDWEEDTVVERGG
jgi:hypothetical protein